MADEIDAANAILRSLGYAERDLAVFAAPKGRALLKGNKLLSPLSDDPATVLRVVQELVPPSDALGTATLRPAELRAGL
ncbi:MAG: hypothetical protein KGL94_05445 [Acidobacteriota bacterium]|nr:hypothetical protein [Acidobacteriota bacterium]